MSLLDEETSVISILPLLIEDDIGFNGSKVELQATCPDSEPASFSHDVCLPDFSPALVFTHGHWVHWFHRVDGPSGRGWRESWNPEVAVKERDPCSSVATSDWMNWGAAFKLRLSGTSGFLSGFLMDAKPRGNVIAGDRRRDVAGAAGSSPTR
ncbi:unnamed protein product [Pleuronectes platessa]|uniref:Uncharacterized protein n=1 Tax=Pleuronectes platessa TaxID=8262 RepID=A0A9N7YXH6_PLEPL|nr:unnamed protein product [Pleuronectes platessa]